MSKKYNPKNDPCVQLKEKLIKNLQYCTDQECIDYVRNSYAKTIEYCRKKDVNAWNFI